MLMDLDPLDLTNATFLKGRSPVINNDLMAP
jgi:hypothetical protein